MNHYKNYEQETNDDAYKYEKRCYDEEELRHEHIRRELERDFFINDRSRKDSNV